MQLLLAALKDDPRASDWQLNGRDDEIELLVEFDDVPYAIRAEVI
jgi:hypothetical protein